jgi:hypothetical protein
MRLSLRDLIASDRRRARLFDGLVSLCIAVVFAGFLYATWFVSQYLGAPMSAFAAPITIALAMVVGRWTSSFVRGLLVRQRIQAMWLRRFQAEGGEAFRTSRVIDRLARDGISTLTLQDRDVRLSLEQRHHRLAPMFWTVTGLLLAAFGVYLAPRVALFGSSVREGMQSFGEVLIFAEVWMLAVLILLAAIGTAAAAGPVETFFFRNRDDYAKLPRLVSRIAAGRRKRGAVVLRISDANWRAAVVSALAAVDVVVIDISQVTDHIAWEIREAVNARGSAALVFICREPADGLSPQTFRVLEASGAPRLPDIVVYPGSRRDRSKARAFASAIREAIYSAMDRVSTKR